MNFEQIRIIERAWVVKSVMINRALILTTIIEDRGFIQKISLNSKKEIEFNIENSKLIIILKNPSWIEYKYDKRTTEECVFNRGKFKIILDELEGI